MSEGISSPLIARCSSLTTHCSLLVAHPLPLPPPAQNLLYHPHARGRAKVFSRLVDKNFKQVCLVSHAGYGHRTGARPAPARCGYSRNQLTQDANMSTNSEPSLLTGGILIIFRIRQTDFSSLFHRSMISIRFY